MKIYTLEHPGVKAPGTPKITIFFPFAILARFTLFAGESSKRSIVGSFCPAYIITSYICIIHFYKKNYSILIYLYINYNNCSDNIM